LQPDRKLGTIGSAGGLIPGIIAKVVKSDGSLAVEGEQGELVVTGPAMALGYYENPSAYVNRPPVCCKYLIMHCVS
jgi:acyl-coenzyme A synthetase/AMP-(fatty) acid ligase